MANITFYHYTTEANKEAIKGSKKIYPSPGIGGKGVYGTTMSPSEYSARAIAENNYDGVVPSGDAEVHWLKQLIAGKVAYAFKIIMPQDQVPRINSDRDIRLYTGGTLDLNNYTYSIIKV